MFNFLFENSRSSGKVDAAEEYQQNSVGCFLINLDRATERLNFVKNRIEQIGFPFHRISAIDGRLLSDEYIDSIADRERYRRYFKMYPEKGTIGCSLSHEKFWREFLLSDYEFALVFEDDVTFDPEELWQCVEKIISAKDRWDVVSFEILHGGCPLKAIDLGNSKYLAVYLTHVAHSGCYLINRKAARCFLKKMYPLVMPLDHYITASWEFDLKFLGVEPRIVWQSFGNSQIKISTPEKFNDSATKISNAAYNVKRALVQFAYNMYVWLQQR